MIVTEGEALQRVIESMLLDVHTALPCRVEAYDPETQSADLQPMLKNVLKDPDGTELEESYPVLPGVPVVFPRAGGFFVSMPLEEGDFVLAIFSEWSVDTFLEKGRETHPTSLSRHTLNGAVCVPGLFPRPEALSEDISADLLVGYDGGTLLRIKSDGTLEMGATGGTFQKVALAADVKAELDGIKAQLDTIASAAATNATHVHVCASPGSPSAPPTVWSGPANSYTASEVGSSKVYAEE